MAPKDAGGFDSRRCRHVLHESMQHLLSAARHLADSMLFAWFLFTCLSVVG